MMARPVRQHSHAKNSSSQRIGALSFPPLVLVSLLLVFTNSFEFGRPLLLLVLVAAVALPFLSPRRAPRHHTIEQLGALTVAFTISALAFRTLEWNAFYNALVMAVCIALVPAFARVSIRGEALVSTVRGLSLLFRVLLTLAWLLQIAGSLALWVNATGFLFLLMYFLIQDGTARYRTKLLWGAGWTTLAWINDDRAYVITLLVLLLAYAFWPWIAARPNVLRFFLLLFFGLLIVGPLLYMYASTGPYRAPLDNLALKYTGDRFFSGRDVIWSRILDSIGSDIVFGSGHSFSAVVIDGRSLSAHNVYISIVSRIGLSGLFLFFLTVGAIISSYARRMCEIPVRGSAAFSVAILFHQSSEMYLIGNNVALAIGSWFVICFGLILINSMTTGERSLPDSASSEADFRDRKLGRCRPNIY